MTPTTRRALTWSDLGVDRHEYVVSGVFAVDGSTYDATFTSENELGRFLDFTLAAPVKPATTRLYLHPDEVPVEPGHQVSNLRFQFDPEHQVAAAVLLVIDRNQHSLRSWRTVGDAAHQDVVLSHDSWNEHQTRLPAESFITISQLRTAVLAWAFGNDVPPQAVSWVEVSGVDWF
jgi:hypothetical protein